MAKYRQIYTDFWNDSFVAELEAEEKFFYLYLLTNAKTTQCGIYDTSKNVMRNETGLSMEKIEEFLKKLSQNNKIIYSEETREIMILNWIKFNTPSGENTYKCINKELSKVKSKSFIEILYGFYKKSGLDVAKAFNGIDYIGDGSFGYSGDSSFEKEIQDNENDSLVEKQIQHTLSCENSYLSSCDSVCETNTCDYNCEEMNSGNNIYKEDSNSTTPLQGVYKDLVSKEIINNKQEVINNNQKIKSNKQKVKSNNEKIINNKKIESDDDSSADDFKNVIKAFDNNIHPITPIEYEKLLDWSNDFSSEVLIAAIEEAVNNNARSIKYINKILNTWLKKGIKTIEGVRADQREWESKKQKTLASKDKKSNFCNYEQRDYDFEDLEKKLLGIG